MPATELHQARSPVHNPPAETQRDVQFRQAVEEHIAEAVIVHALDDAARAVDQGAERAHLVQPQ